MALLGGVNADDFLPYIYQKRSPEQLIETLDFYFANSEIAYQVLSTQHFEFVKERIKTDLDDEFETLKKNSYLRMQNSYGDAAKVILREWKPSTIDFVKGNFIAAALEGLAINGDPEDIKYARKYLNSKYSSTLEPALVLISKYGDESDVERLLLAAKEAYGENKKKALKQAFDLSTNKENLLDELINEEDKSISKQAAILIREINTEVRIEKAKNILYHKNEDLRLIGLAILLELMSEKDLEAILQDYINTDSYYYNVVSWLDQILYAPPSHRDIYKKKLFKETII